MADPDRRASLRPEIQPRSILKLPSAHSAILTVRLATPGVTKGYHPPRACSTRGKPGPVDPIRGGLIEPELRCDRGLAEPRTPTVATSRRERVSLWWARSFRARKYFLATRCPSSRCSPAGSRLRCCSGRNGGETVIDLLRIPKPGFPSLMNLLRPSLLRVSRTASSSLRRRLVFCVSCVCHVCVFYESSVYLMCVSYASYACTPPNSTSLPALCVSVPKNSPHPQFQFYRSARSEYPKYRHIRESVS